MGPLLLGIGPVTLSSPTSLPEEPPALSPKRCRWSAASMARPPRVGALAASPWLPRWHSDDARGGCGSFPLPLESCQDL
eukprot:11179628-Lingulodinium_polyedra.AAC.1